MADATIVLTGRLAPCGHVVNLYPQERDRGSRSLHFVAPMSCSTCGGFVYALGDVYDAFVKEDTDARTVPA